MAKSSEDKVTTQSAKKYCAQRRSECIDNLLNATINLPDNGGESNLSEFFKAGDQDILRKVFNTNLSDPTKPSFNNLSSNQTNQLFNQDNIEQQNLQTANYQSLLRNDMATYDKVCQQMSENHQQTLETLERHQRALENHFEETVHEMIEQGCEDPGTLLNETLDLDLTDEEIQDFSRKCEQLSTKGKSNSAFVDRLIEEGKQRLKEVHQKEKNEIDRLYQQRQNNLNQFMLDTEATIAFQHNRKLVNQATRRLLKTNETDEEIERKSGTRPEDLADFENIKMAHARERDKMQGQGRISLFGDKADGPFSKPQLIIIDWRYNKESNTYTFSCDLSNLSEANRTKAVKNLIATAVEKGATWIDISNIGDSVFLESGDIGSLRNGKASSAINKKLSLMADAVEEAAYRGIKPENIRGVNLQKNEKLLAAYQAGVNRRMNRDKNNGSFSIETNRKLATELGHYSEIKEGDFLQTAMNNGFEAQVQGIPNNQLTADNLKLLGNQSSQHCHHIQNQLDEFVDNYNPGKNQEYLSRQELLTLRNDTFTKVCKDENQLMQRYHQWEQDNTEHKEEIRKKITPLKKRPEDNQQKNNKDLSNPNSYPVKSSPKEENEENIENNSPFVDFKNL